MYLDLTDEQRILKDSAAKFCKAEFESEKLRAMIEREPTGLPDELWRKIAEQGWIGTILPEQYGGLGLGVTELGIIMEEMGKALDPGPFFSCAALGGPAIALGGTGAAKSKWLEKIVAGEVKATLALIEKDAQLGAKHVKLKAEKNAEGGYTLNGKKFFVPDLQSADIIVVAARTSKGEDGTTLFIVEKSAPGVSCKDDKLTDMTSRSGLLSLKDVKVGADAIIGGIDSGGKIIEQVLQIANVGIAAASIAASEKILHSTISYTKERYQFGVPIGSFQAVKHPLANLYAEMESARSAYHYAAWAYDAKTTDARPALATARITCVEAYRRATLDCLQAHGGIGFTWELDLHLFLKRAKHYQYFLGVESDYEEVVAREAIGI
ncbi:acyl-CoA/acyl-ACP dehydrogenase [Candidatus Sumerlaeota bacterium]|nr:acyl-CoA/acyl-ACP dehydrogenase [Candidatus Sumerlaeota bacterium]